MKTRNHQRTIRRGLTILEVITAILVAVIGVFGVVAIIPFAVRQTEIGLNQEDAINAARNTQHRFETLGFKASRRWSNANPAIPGAGGAYAEHGIATDIRAFCIDPVGISQYLGEGQAFNNWRSFPRTSLTLPASFPTLVYDYDPATGARTGSPPTPVQGIPRVTLLNRSNLPLSRALSRQVFGYENDLVYQSPNERAEPPTPGFFRDSGANFKRETNGSVTMMAFIVGKGDTSNEYTMFTVVFRRRLANAEDRIFQVTSPAPTGVGTLFGGGDIAVNELSTPGPDAAQISRNDWVMLLNRDDPMISDAHNIRSMQFYRVVEAYELPSSTDRRFTLRGGDFEMRNAAGTALPTFMIYMPNVLAVYEHTFRFEATSNWN